MNFCLLVNNYVMNKNTLFYIPIQNMDIKNIHYKFRIK